MESEIAGWISVLFRFIHVLAAIMWIGNSLLFTWMELNLIAPPKAEPDPNAPANPLLGHLDMLHGGGVFHLEKRIIDPNAIPVPLHWFMWQSYTTWLTGAVLLVSVFYIHGGAALLDTTKSSLPGTAAIVFSLVGIVGGWVVYDSLWRSKLKERVTLAIPLSLLLLIAAAIFFNQFFNGRAVYLQIGAMLGSFMSANVFFHIIRNQKKFMASLKAGLPHDPNYGKQAKLRSLHNHYMTFPVLFLMLSAHFPQLTSAERSIPILAVIIVSLMAVKYFMNSRNHHREWLVSMAGTFCLAVILIGALLAFPPKERAFTPVASAGTEPSAPAAPPPGVKAGAKLFVSQGCAACHQVGSSQLGPSLQAVHGSTRILSDGTRVVATDAYLRNSILLSQSQVVKGYPPAMPSFSHLDPAQVDDLVAYIKSIK
jgi:uncharacterized membrane protein